MLIALASFFPVASWASSAETHAGTIATLNEKQENVLALSALSATASIAVSTVPSDVGSSISDQLADISSDLAVIVVAILTEKYLLTVIALVSFKVLVPVACLLFALSLWGCFREMAGRPVSFKLAVFGVLLFLVVSASAFLADCSWLIASTKHTGFPPRRLLPEQKRRLPSKMPKIVRLRLEKRGSSPLLRTFRELRSMQ